MERLRFYLDRLRYLVLYRRHLSEAEIAAFHAGRRLNVRHLREHTAFCAQCASLIGCHRLTERVIELIREP